MPTVKPGGYFSSLAEALSGTEFTEIGGNSITADAGFERIEALLLRHVACPERKGSNARGKVLLVGNGGSAAIASHIHNDLSKTLGVRALIFNEAPLLTALANDIEYDAAFERNTELWAEEGDLVIAISSSGRSENILRAVKASHTNGSHVVTLSGFSPGNPLRRLGDVNMYVPSSSYGHVEIAHLALLHCLTDRLAAQRGDAAVIAWETPKQQASGR